LARPVGQQREEVREVMLYERRGIDDSEFVSMAIRRERARIDGAITKFLLERVWLKGGRQVCPVCDNVFVKVAYDWAMSCGFWDVYFKHNIWGPACQPRLCVYAVKVVHEPSDAMTGGTTFHSPNELGAIMRAVRAMAGGEA
jgi:hypothetical protein